MRAAFPWVRISIGTDLWSHIKVGSNATFDFTDQTTGEVSLTTIRKVKGHPLWVSVSTNKSEIFKELVDHASTPGDGGSLCLR